MNSIDKLVSAVLKEDGEEGDLKFRDVRKKKLFKKNAIKNLSIDDKRQLLCAVEARTFVEDRPDESDAFDMFMNGIVGYKQKSDEEVQKEFENTFGDNPNDPFLLDLIDQYI
jgi:hypothetical protein